MKRLILAVAGAVMASLMMPLMASAATYETYVGCGLTESTAPSEVCEIGSPVGAFFESDEETEYEVCVEFPNGEFLCAAEQEASQGVLYVNKITTDMPGTHYAVWYVEGVEVAEWPFRMDSPPPPPAPPAVAPPAPPAPPVVSPPGPSAACLQAKKRVGSLQSRLRRAVLPKAKNRLRAKLKQARVEKRRLC
jgi:hypothetical protein